MVDEIGCCLVCRNCGFKVFSPLLTDTIIAQCTSCGVGVMTYFMCITCNSKCREKNRLDYQVWEIWRGINPADTERERN